MILSQILAKIEQLQAKHPYDRAVTHALREIRTLVETEMSKWTVLLYPDSHLRTEPTLFATVVEAASPGEAEFLAGLDAAREYHGASGDSFEVVGVYRGELVDETTRISLEGAREDAPNSFKELQNFFEVCKSEADGEAPECWSRTNFEEFCGDQVFLDDIEAAWERREDYLALTGQEVRGSDLLMTNVYTHFQIRNNRHFDCKGDLMPESELLEEHPVTSEIHSQMRSCLAPWANGPCSPQDWEDNTMVDPDGTITITCPNDPVIYAVAKPEVQP